MGLVHLYHGDGKGKTSTAIGLAVRCSGYGRPVVFTQFLKGGHTGELNILKSIPCLQVLRREGPVKFSFQMTEEEKALALEENNRLFKQAISLCNKEVILPEKGTILPEKGTILPEKGTILPEKGTALLVLDEAIGAMDVGLLSKEQVYDFLTARPKDLEVVLTGRNPDSNLIELADYVSEIKKIKHPYDRGVCAREGIEF